MAFALSATSTAGTGTISIARNGTTVTGVGTDFVTQALNGKIILINNHNALVTAVASATSMTINRAPTFAISGATFSFVPNGTRIDQTGTDTNPSGLGAIQGVFGLNDGTAPSIQSYDIGALLLYIQGTMTIPDTYWVKATGGAAGGAIVAGNTGKLIIDSRNTLPRDDGTSVTTYSLACGIQVRKPSGLPYSVDTIRFDSGSQFEQYGGVVETSGTIRWINTTTSIATMKQATWYVYNRSGYGYQNIYFNLDKIAIDGLTIYSNNTAYPGLLKTLATGYSVKGFAVRGGLGSISAIDGTTALVRLDNFFGGESKFDFLVRNGGTAVGEGTVGGYDFYDANIGNNLLAGTNGTGGETRGRARHYVTYAPTFLNATTTAGIVGGMLYLKDTNNGSRVSTNGVPGDKVYINTSGAGGAFTSFPVLTKVWSGTGVNPMNQDVRLPISGYFWAYGYRGTPVSITSSIGPQSPTLYAPTDENVTLSKSAAAAKLASSFTVDPVGKMITVTANSTYDDLYDAMVAYKCDTTQVNLETPTAGSLITTHTNGALIAATGWNLTVATGVVLSEGVKARKVVFSTITTLGTGKVTGIYETIVGTSVRVNFANLL